MRVALLFSFSKESVLAEVREFLPELGRWVPPKFSRNYQEHALTPTALLVWWSPDLYMVPPSSEQILTNRAGKFFCTGYATGSGATARGLEEIADPKRMTFRDSPGGVGSWFWTPDGHATIAWSTQPSAHGLFVGKQRRDFVVIGNRPLLVHLASKLSPQETSDPEYASDYLTCGFSLAGKTAWLGTRSVGPRTALKIHADVVTDAPHVLPDAEPMSADATLEDKGLALVKELRRAVEPAMGGGIPCIHLSGGKDSRLVAAAVHSQSANGAAVDAVTYGMAGAGEAAVSASVAEVLGFQLEVRSQRYRSHVPRILDFALHRTEGLGLQYAHQAPFVIDAGLGASGAVLNGKSHLLRGGHASTMGRQSEYLERRLIESYISPFVQDADPYTKSLASWREERAGSFRDVRDVLFFANHDLLLGAGSHATLLELESHAFMVWPLLDERVSRFAMSLTVYDRVSERVFFWALQHMSKQVASLPLFEEGWRFDRNLPFTTNHQDSDHNFEDGFHSRQPLPLRAATNGQGFVWDYDGSGLVSPVELSLYVLGSPAWAVLGRLVTHQLSSSLTNLAQGRGMPDFVQNAVDRQVLMSFIWRLAIASRMIERS